jgi:hypothetical protein
MTDLQTVTMPALMTIPNVEVLACGEWSLSTGMADFTAQDLADGVDAAQCPAIGDPRLKIGHADPRFTPGDYSPGAEPDGEPAIGKVTNMSLTAEGMKITGDFSGMPGWLGAIASSAFPQRSIEGYRDVQCQIGHIHPFVISAVALLGLTGPGVGVLNDLADLATLYGVENAARGTEDEIVQPAEYPAGPRWTVQVRGSGMPTNPKGDDKTSAAGTTTEDVRRAFYAQPDQPWSWWITSMQLNPAQLIVCDDMTDQVYRVPMTLGTDGDVTFGDAVEVKVEYVDGPDDVKAAAAAVTQTGVRAMIAAAAADPGHSSQRRSSRAGAIAYAKTKTSTGTWSASAQVKNLPAEVTQAALRNVFAWEDPDGTATARTSYRLAHHFVGDDGTPGDASTVACAAAIGLLNGTGADIPDGDRQATYDHLAQHLADAGLEVPDLGSDAAGPHGSYTGTHTHAHSAMGAQGTDETHEHEHSHEGDAQHGHSHEAKAKGSKTAKAKGADVEFTDEQKTAIRTRLGLADDAELTAEQIAGAFLAEGESQPVAAAGPATMVIDRDQWAEVNRRLQTGEQARASQLLQERDRVIDDAIKAGKFTAGRRKVYEDIWAASPQAMKDAVQSLVPGVVRMSAVGSPGGESVTGDPEYHAIFGQSQPA